jgi:polyketide synthase PksN
MKSQILLDSGNPLLCGHQVFAQRLFPGLAYIDFLFQLFRSHGHDYRTLELRNVLIFSAITAAENADVFLTVESEQTAAGQWQIVVSGQERRQGMAIGPQRRYASAEMWTGTSTYFDEVIELDRMRSAVDTGPLAAVYAGARRNQLIHSGFMKAKGTLHVLDGILYADVELPAEASSSASRFMFHPTLLDGSVVGIKGAAASLLQEPDARLYLPLSYGSFRAAALLSQRCIARARQAAFRRQNDVSFIDVDFFDERGVKIAELRNFASKLVHAREHIQSGSADVERVATLLDSAPVVPTHEAGGGKLGAQAFLRDIMAARLGCAAPSIDADVGYYELGLTSVQLLELVGDIERKLGTAVAPTLLFEYATINDLAEHLAEQYSQAFLAARVDSTNAPFDAQEFLRKLIAQRLDAPLESIDVSVGYYELGLTSVHLLELVGDMERRLGVTLSPTLLFEYATIADLAEHIVQHYSVSFAAQAREQPKQPVEIRSLAEVPSSLPAQDAPAADTPDVIERDIAIIGLSGRYPQAQTVEEFWENLKAGRDSITEIPTERWNHQLYFDAEKGKPGKCYSKWGGFIDGFDRFDPLFFNISPRDAAFMDPQERLFLQCVYEAMEDAGYTRDSLGKSTGEGDIGVFVGVMYQEYQLYGAQAQALGQPISLSGNPSSIANRVSYFCNFRGPSVALDTMCSSSLTAIHLARQSLQRGECDVAIAGGVNLSIHPNKYLGLSQGQFASSKGRCESFGEGGDGYVPGEGVGAVVLKRLSQAIADGDQIYGVIKASRINHGGKTSGYTVPNLNAQAKVISRALRESGVPPRAISYIEAHGTGTSLGDPIEIAGLSKAFAEFTDDTQFCAIGSAKSNIGHLESAAGIAGLTKVLLQMKHGQLVPSLHSRVLNAHIDFSDTPFVVQQELGEWRRPQIQIDGRVREYPRIAGISSFGAGGSNAHLLIEEYRAPVAMSLNVQPAIIVLSAKSEERLRVQARQLLQTLHRYGEADLASIAYTLQVGREAMEQRLALTVSSLAGLVDKLTRYLAKERNIEELYRGEVKRNDSALTGSTGDEDIARLVDAWVQKRKYTKLLELWVQGLMFDWQRLYGDVRPRRISLPTYPFTKERYWLDLTVSAPVIDSQRVMLHPLLHENTSTLLQQSFSARFSGEEFFFNEHRVLGESVLPGVAYLEMAREAIQRSDGSHSTDVRGLRLKNIVWSHPAIIRDSALELGIRLHQREQAGEIEYEIYSGGEPRRVVHSQGAGELLEFEQRPRMDLHRLQSCVTSPVVEASRLYESHSAAGLQYGPSHQAVQSIQVGADESGHFALARLMLPSSQMEVRERYVLHPSLFDSALHAWRLLSTASRSSVRFPLEAGPVCEKARIASLS